MAKGRKWLCANSPLDTPLRHGKGESAMKIYLSVDKRECDGALQISINAEDENGGGHGYRIAGPKYDGRGVTLLKHYITERDVSEMVQYLVPSRKRKLKYDKATRTIVAPGNE